MSDALAYQYGAPFGSRSDAIVAMQKAPAEWPEGKESLS